MSVLGKKWLIKNNDKLKSTFQKLLENRGIQDLSKIDDANFHDPFLFADMEKATERIKKAIENEERIIVFGDYDVDGISSSAILVNILKKLKAKVSYRLPHREKDGYGLSEKFINEFKEKDVKLVITVDCGISCYKEIEIAKEQGIDIIITDHHTIPAKAPEAHAIIHPKLDSGKYPYKELTGSGVAFKLAHGLIIKMIPEEEQEALLESFIDLASLGTIADLGPLTGENRLIVKRGLKALGNTKWHGLKHLLQKSQPRDAITTQTIGFKIGPRINAAGRIGDPYIALQLLLQEPDSTKIPELGNKLEELNSKRQTMTFSALEEAKAIFADKEEIPAILVAHSPDWHVGILGLIAGKLAEKYSRPAIIMQDLGDELVASARGPEFFNIIEALTELKQYLPTFGGHTAAAGFNIPKENLQEFTEKIQEYAAKKLSDTALTPTLKIDCTLNNDEISFDLLEKMEQLEPFGVANSQPTFLLKNVSPQFISQVGKQAAHLKFTIGKHNAIAFNMGHFAEDMRRNKNIDLVCQINRNRWNNKDSIQIRALDFKFYE